MKITTPYQEKSDISENSIFKCVSIVLSFVKVIIIMIEDKTAIHLRGSSINYVDKQGGGGLAKCLQYHPSLCSKLVCEGGGVKNPVSVNVVY